jgi:hypothetical protein
MLPHTHSNVAGFEVTVDKVSGVDVTQATDLAKVRTHQSGSYEVGILIDSPTGLLAVKQS